MILYHQLERNKKKKKKSILATLSGLKPLNTIVPTLQHEKTKEKPELTNAEQLKDRNNYQKIDHLFV